MSHLNVLAQIVNGKLVLVVPIEMQFAVTNPQAVEIELPSTGIAVDAGAAYGSADAVGDVEKSDDVVSAIPVTDDNGDVVAGVIPDSSDVLGGVTVGDSVFVQGDVFVGVGKVKNVFATPEDGGRTDRPYPQIVVKHDTNGSRVLRLSGANDIAKATRVTPADFNSLNTGSEVIVTGDIYNGKATVRRVHSTSGGRDGRDYPQVVVRPHSGDRRRVIRYSGADDVAKIFVA